MIEPMRLWLKGYSVVYIVNCSDISVGHFCKECLRMKELLSQIRDVCNDIGNYELRDKIEHQKTILEKGLPFIPSSMIK